MRAILRQQRLSSALTAAAVILLGLVLLVWPDLTAELMCRVLGLGVLLAGVVYLLGWLRSRGQEEGRIFFLLPGAVLVGLGLWLLTRPESVITLVQLVSGVVLVFHGLLERRACGVPGAVFQLNRLFVRLGRFCAQGILNC